MRLRFALGAWSNKHFEHTLYPLRTLHAEYLPRYATKFDAVEANVLHHQMPGEPGDEDAPDPSAWAKAVPPGFTFLPKMHKNVTHPVEQPPGVKVVGPRNRVALAQQFLDGLEPLRAAGKLGPVLLQFPPETDRTKGWDLLERLLALADPGAFVVEVRHTSWFVDAFADLLETHEAPLVWSTFPKAFAPPWTAGSFGYVRFTGKHTHTRGRHVTVADRLNDVLEVRKRLAHARWKECFVVVTNGFEGNAVDSLPRIAAALGGPEQGLRFARPPAGVMFPDA